MGELLRPIGEPESLGKVDMVAKVDHVEGVSMQGKLPERTVVFKVSDAEVVGHFLGKKAGPAAFFEPGTFVSITGDMIAQSYHDGNGTRVRRTEVNIR